MKTAKASQNSLRTDMVDSKHNDVLAENLVFTEWKEFIDGAISGELFNDEPRWTISPGPNGDATLLSYPGYMILCGTPDLDSPYSGYFIWGSSDYMKISRAFNSGVYN